MNEEQKNQRLVSIKDKLHIINVKKLMKWMAIILVATVAIGGAAHFALEKMEKSQDAKTQQALTTMIQAQAKQNSVVLLDEASIKSEVSAQTGINQADLTYSSITLGYLGEQDQRGDRHDNEPGDKESQNEPASKTTVAAKTIVYRIECSANSVKYELIIDAVEGTVYQCDIEK